MPLGPVEVLVGGVEAVKAPVAISGEQLPLNGIGCGVATTTSSGLPSALNCPIVAPSAGASAE